MVEHMKQFNKLWNDFIVKLNGQILKRSADGMPSIKQMNMILEDCALDWVTEETICGRWFLEYETENPNHGRLIRQVLLEDMRFRECEAQPELPNSAHVVVPAVGAVAGLALSRMLGAGAVVQTAAAIVPAVALSPAMKHMDAQLRSKNIQKLTEEYLLQLDMYYRSILSVLES